MLHLPRQDYISSFANLRARNYSIEEVEKLQARLIAGLSPRP